MCPGGRCAIAGQQANERRAAHVAVALGGCRRSTTSRTDRTRLGRRPRIRACARRAVRRSSVGRGALRRYRWCYRYYPDHPRTTRSHSSWSSPSGVVPGGVTPVGAVWSAPPSAQGERGQGIGRGLRAGDGLPSGITRDFPSPGHPVAVDPDDVGAVRAHGDHAELRGRLSSRELTSVGGIKDHESPLILRMTKPARAGGAGDYAHGGRAPLGARAMVSWPPEGAFTWPKSNLRSIYGIELPPPLHHPPNNGRWLSCSSPSRARLTGARQAPPGREQPTV
jgi:hypothetical protein